MNECVDKWQLGVGGCCSLIKSTVKIFDIYTEESEYIQATRGEEGDLSHVRGTFGTANTQPIPARSVTVLCSLVSLLSLQQGSWSELFSYFSFMWYSLGGGRRSKR